MHCWVYLEFQFFCMGCLRQKPVLLKSYQKLFPSVSSEPLKVPWCFICQTKSPHVEIKWLKGYCIPSTFTENIPDQSCISNRWTPCSMRRSVGHYQDFYSMFGVSWVPLLPRLTKLGRVEDEVCSTCTIVMQMNVREKSIVQRRTSLRAWPHFPKVTEGNNVCRARDESLLRVEPRRK